MQKPKTKPTPLVPQLVDRTVREMFADSDLHAKQIESLTHAIIGAVATTVAGVASIGRAAAGFRGKDDKHGIKQFDRLLSNRKIDDADLARQHMAFAIGQRRRVVLSLDWTEYGLWGQNRLAINVVTRHGRATPLLCKTVPSAELKGQMSHIETGLLRVLQGMLPPSVKEVIIVADRGFGNVDLYEAIQALGFHFVIRFRGCIHVTAPDGRSAPAASWVPAGGRARRIRNALLTGQHQRVAAFIAVKKAKMKDSWLLATSLCWDANRVVALYARRFTCEENFRDEKDPRFGLGSRLASIKDAARRDRLCLILSIAMAIVTLLGVAGEKLGFDRLLRANTVNRRTHSLFRQGREYLRTLTHHVHPLAGRLLAEFQRLLSRQPLTRGTFAHI